MKKVKMARRFAVSYVESQFQALDAGGPESVHSMVEIASMIDVQPNYTEPNHELPEPAFAFVESLYFFLQVGSGIATYFEALPPEKQERVRIVLKKMGPPSLAEWYERGMSVWEDEESISLIEDCLEAGMDDAFEWLANIVKQNKQLFIDLSA